MRNNEYKSKLMTFDTFKNRDEFDLLLNDFLNSEEGIEVLKLYYDNVYKVEMEDELKLHNENMLKLKNDYTQKEEEVFSVIEELESTIKDKQQLLEYIEDEISRKELTEQYLKRNDVFSGRKESLETRILEKSKMLEEKNNVDSDSDIVNEDTVVEETVTELTGAEELSFNTYVKGTKQLVEIKKLVRDGMTFNEGLEIVIKDRSIRELIGQGVVKLEENRTKILTVTDMIEHLYK